MACLKKEGKFEGNGKQRMFKSPIINKCVRAKVDEGSSCCKRPSRIAVTSTLYATRACRRFFSLTAKPNIQDSTGRTRMPPKVTCSNLLDNKKCQVLAQQQCTFMKQCSCESQCYESISQAVATCFFFFFFTVQGYESLPSPCEQRSHW